MAQVAKPVAPSNNRGVPRRPTYELEIAVVAVGAVTGLYLWISRNGTPLASSLFGHGLGVIGFVLMLATETLYSLRKRARGRAFGRLSTWLQWHIVMGIVGSYMVLLHTAWQFNGLAGVVTLLTAVVVISGFVGRYIYTAIPRTVDGAELSLAELEARREAISAELAEVARQSGEAASAVGDTNALLAASLHPSNSAIGIVFGRFFTERRERAALHKAMARLNMLGGDVAQQALQLLDEQTRLRRQLSSLTAARRLLALWHTVHVPIGVSLFILAFIHLGGALYYATLLR